MTRQEKVTEAETKLRFVAMQNEVEKELDTLLRARNATRDAYAVCRVKMMDYEKQLKALK